MSLGLVSVHGYENLVDSETFTEGMNIFRNLGADIYHVRSANRGYNPIGIEEDETVIEDINGGGALPSSYIHVLKEYDELVAIGADANKCIPHFLNRAKYGGLEPKIDSSLSYLNDRESPESVEQVLEGENPEERLNHLFMSAPEFL